MNLRDGFSDGLLECLRQRHIPFAIVTAYHTLPTNAGENAVTTLHKRSIISNCSNCSPTKSAAAFPAEVKKGHESEFLPHRTNHSLHRRP